MAKLTEQHCKPCEGGVAALTKTQATAQLQALPTWQLNESATAIYRRFEFKNFFITMNFVNAIAWIAAQEKHHPDVQFGYNYCQVSFTTHAIKGLSMNDFIAAAKIEELSRDLFKTR